MAKKKKNRKKAAFKIPLAATAGILSPFISKAPSGGIIVDDLMRGDIAGALYNFKEKFSGVDADGNFRLDWVVNTYKPVIIGALISKFVGGRPLNLNRMLRNIPYVKI